jgi:hypothetical protein
VYGSWTKKPRRKKVAVTLPGTVEKFIPSIGNVVPEKAHIQVEGADDLYREVRIDNTRVGRCKW